MDGKLGWGEGEKAPPLLFHCEGSEGSEGSGQGPCEPHRAPESRVQELLQDKTSTKRTGENCVKVAKLCESLRDGQKNSRVSD